MRRNTLLVAVFLVGLVPVEPVLAIEVSTPWQERSTVQVTQSASLRYQIKDFDSVDYDDGVFMWLNKLNITLDSSPIRAGLRLDSTWMVTDPACGEQFEGTCPIRSEHGFERLQTVFLTWSGKGWSATWDYTSWGQGLVLNLKKVDELGVDTTLRGGRIMGRHGGLAVEAIAGQTNIQNIELFRGSFEVLEDPKDTLVGLQSTFSLDNVVEVGVRGVQAYFETPENFQHEVSDPAGGSLELPH